MQAIRIHLFACCMCLLTIGLAGQVKAGVTKVSPVISEVDRQPASSEPSEQKASTKPTSEQNERLDRSQSEESELPSSLREKRVFAVELLKILHEQYSKNTKTSKLNQVPGTAREDSAPVVSKQLMMSQLLGAISADGDLPRLIDWVQNSFNMASMGDLMTQFVISKLGSVNCAALLKPTDSEASLMPRFLLFNEHFSDVPFELPANPSSNECLGLGKFDPLRKTMILIHGYLSGYTLVDGLTNIKNRLLDLNRYVEEGAMRALYEVVQSNGTYELAEDLHLKVRQQQYNVILVDWFNGANPVPRASYIKSAVNAPVVGKLIAHFLSSLVLNCRTRSSQLQILAHSLGCHVAGFTGKTMNTNGLRLGKIIHLDPVGLCFGRLFSETRFRLSPDDAIETQAVHVSLNLFDNPLDGTHSNFLVSGGRDQPGCTGQSELKNSTTSTVSLLFDSEAKFSPCSHLRALALFEDDHSSKPGECQMVGYRCQNYESFLAGQCGRCDSQNSQCRLMNLPPIQTRFRRYSPKAVTAPPYQIKAPTEKAQVKIAHGYNDTLSQSSASLLNLVNEISNSSVAWLVDDHELDQKIGNTIAKLRPQMLALEKADMASTEQPSEANNTSNVNPSDTYSDRWDEAESESGSDSDDEELSGSDAADQEEPARREDPMMAAGSERLMEHIDKIKSDTKQMLLEGWTQLTSPEHKPRLVGLQMKPRFPIPTIMTVPDTGALEHGFELDVETVEIPEDPHAVHAVDVAAAWDQKAPLGSQKVPFGSINGPMYFLGTGAITPYCVNYYQLRVLIAESRINKLLANNLLARGQMGFSSANDLLGAPEGPLQQHQHLKSHPAVPQRDILHLTVKLIDSMGHFFKGFTMSENARTIPRVPIMSARQRALSASENMLELTMLLNSTQSKPVRIGEIIISYYFHSVVLADLVEVNYMSNISPDIRSRYSSVLCPMAINDRHQLVRYVECDTLSPSVGPLL